MPTLRMRRRIKQSIKMIDADPVSKRIKFDWVSFGYCSNSFYNSGRGRLITTWSSLDTALLGSVVY